jgi:hypothetical protein
MLAATTGPAPCISSHALRRSAAAEASRSRITLPDSRAGRE